MELNRNSLSSFYVAVFLEKYVDEANQNQKKNQLCKTKNFSTELFNEKKNRIKHLPEWKSMLIVWYGFNSIIGIEETYTNGRFMENIY